MRVFRIVWLVHFQMRFQILRRLIFNAADATFEIFTILMRAHMTINQEARREIFATDLATAKKGEQIKWIRGWVKIRAGFPIIFGGDFFRRD